MELQDKVALIAGASGGIGGAIAKELSAKGCKLALVGRDLKKLQELKNQLTEACIVIEMNVADTEDVKKGFAQLFEHYDRLDILINSAGIMPLTYLKNGHLEEWLDTIEVNVKGALRLLHGALPTMIAQKNGHIVTIASIDGRELYAGGAIYGASKAALIALSQAMRMELSPEYNIRVTSIDPGTVETDLRQDISDKELLEDKNYGGVEAKLKPDDIARVVAFAVGEPGHVNINELMIKPTGKS